MVDDVKVKFAADVSGVASGTKQASDSVRDSTDDMRAQLAALQASHDQTAASIRDLAGATRDGFEQMADSMQPTGAQIVKQAALFEATRSVMIDGAAAIKSGFSDLGSGVTATFEAIGRAVADAASATAAWVDDQLDGGLAAQLAAPATQAAEAFRDLARAEGISQSAMRDVADAARGFGASNDTVIATLQRLQNPTQDVTRAVAAFGLSLKDLDSSNPIDFMQKLIQASKDYADTTAKNENLTTIFGTQSASSLKAIADATVTVNSETQRHNAILSELQDREKATAAELETLAKEKGWIGRQIDEIDQFFTRSQEFKDRQMLIAQQAGAEWDKSFAELENFNFSKAVAHFGEYVDALEDRFRHMTHGFAAGLGAGSWIDDTPAPVIHTDTRKQQDDPAYNKLADGLADFNDKMAKSIQLAAMDSDAQLKLRAEDQAEADMRKTLADSNMKLADSYVAAQVARARGLADQQVEAEIASRPKKWEDPQASLKEVNDEVQAEAAKMAAVDQQLRQADIDATIEAANTKAETEKTLIKSMSELHRISGEDELAQLQNVENQRYAIEQKALQDRLALYNQDAVQKERINKQIEQAELHHNLVMAQASAEAAKTQGQEWKAISDTIERAADRSVQGIVTGQQTASQALANIGNSLVAESVNTGIKRLGEWVRSEIGMTAATEAGAQARVAAQAAANVEGAAASKQSNQGEIFEDAKVAAAGAYKAVVGIPIIGPVLAPIAAGVAFAAVEAFGSFDVGAWNLPSDQLAMVHKGETILPAPFAEDFRSAMSGRNSDSASASPGGGGGSTIGALHVHFTANGRLTKGEIMEHSGVIADAVRKAVRDLHPVGRPRG